MAEPIKQAINFYQDEFKTPEIILPAKQMLMIVGLVMVGFLIAGFYQNSLIRGLEEKTANYETRANQLAEQYETLQANFVEPQKDTGLLKELENIKDNIEERNKLKVFLEKEAAKTIFSFADVLYGLAVSNTKNVWLTKIMINTAGNFYQLQGKAKHAENIPDYIELLKTTEALKGTYFNLFDVEKSKQSHLLHFVLSSEQDVAENNQ